MGKRGKQIVELQREIYAMPEMIIIERIKNFGHTLEILQGNYRELKKHLEYHADFDRSRHLWDVKNRHLLDAFKEEVTRLLHNFVAAAMSCIDNSRVLYKHVYENESKFPDYQDEVKKRFSENSLAAFIVCLRQYCQHYKTPNIQSELSTKDLPKINSRLQLVVKDLQEFKSWNSKAKEFLENNAEKIDLLNLVDNYYNLLVDFYKWFDKRQKDICNKELEAINRKQGELRELVVLDILERDLINKETFEEEFILILSPEERKELETCVSNLADRCQKILQFIQQRTRLSEELRSKVQNLYLK